MESPNETYRPRRPWADEWVPLRGGRYHVQRWGEAAADRPPRVPLVLLHGWMDVAASWQFVVDALAEAEGFERLVLAPDWRGFGLSGMPPTDSYWFPDYLADLDALLDRLVPEGPLDLVGHSMGGNIAMTYAGLRPARIRRLVNLEGFGMPQTKPEQAPERLVKWLDELKQPMAMKTYASLDEVAARLQQNNPLLPAAKAAWLAPHWARQGEDGRWHLLGDPAHKRVNPVLYRREEAMATWRRITAPVLWMEGNLTDIEKWWGHRYPRSDFEERLAVVARLERAVLAPSGHMLHHDQPEALARRLAAFLA